MSQVQTSVGQTFDETTPNLGASSGTTAHTFFGPANRAYTVKGASVTISAQGGSGATINIFHDIAQAPGAGSSILSAAQDLHALTVNTPTAQTLATGAVLNIGVGDCLSYQLQGTLTALADCIATVELIPA